MKLLNDSLLKLVKNSIGKTERGRESCCVGEEEIKCCEKVKSLSITESQKVNSGCLKLINQELAT